MASEEFGVMNRGFTLLYICTMLLVLAGCTSIDCPLNSSVYSYYGLYKADGTADTLNDTLTIITRQLTPEQDPVLINQDTKVSRLKVAMSYDSPQDVLYFLMHGTRTYNDTVIVDNDTTVNVVSYSVGLTDTVTVEKTDEMHFESVDCNPSFFHTISRVTHTKHVIDSIVIQNPKVDYDSQREHFRIYFRTLD